MICPQTKQECVHLAFCDITGECMKQQCAAMDKTDADVRGVISDAEARNLERRAAPTPVGDFNLFTSPPPPTMAEIERLVDAYKDAMLNFERDNCAHYRKKEEAARAVLLAAIQKLTQ